MSHVGHEVFVDIGDTEQEVGCALKETHVDIGHHGHASDDGGASIHRNDVPGPARDRNTGQNVIVLFATRRTCRDETCSFEWSPRRISSITAAKAGRRCSNAVGSSLFALAKP